MPTTAPQPKTTIDPRVQAAWDSYRDDLRDLEGAAYEQAEKAAWDRLQADLFTLTDEADDGTTAVSL